MSDISASDFWDPLRYDPHIGSDLMGGIYYLRNVSQEYTPPSVPRFSPSGVVGLLPFEAVHHLATRLQRTKPGKMVGGFTGLLSKSEYSAKGFEGSIKYTAKPVSFFTLPFTLLLMGAELSGAAGEGRATNWLSPGTNFWRRVGWSDEQLKQRLEDLGTSSVVTAVGINATAAFKFALTGFTLRQGKIVRWLRMFDGPAGQIAVNNVLKGWDFSTIPSLTVNVGHEYYFKSFPLIRFGDLIDYIDELPEDEDFRNITDIVAHIEANPNDTSWAMQIAANVLDTVRFCDNGVAENCTVTPASGTILLSKGRVTIEVKALPNRELLSVIVKGKEYVGADPDDWDFMIPSSEKPKVTYDEFGYPITEHTTNAYQRIPPTKERIIINIPVGDEDFCVYAIASDRIINLPPQPAGTFVEKVLETDECYPSKTWEITDSSIFQNASLSPDEGLKQNTLSFYIPESTVTGTFEMRIRLNGKTQTVDYIVRVPVTAIEFETFAFEKLQVFEDVFEDPRDLIKTTTGDIYLLTELHMYKANINLTQFTRMSLDGVLDTNFVRVAESYNNRIFVIDNTQLWELNKDTNTLEQTTLTFNSHLRRRILAHPECEYIGFSEGDVSWRPGNYVYITSYHVDDFTSPVTDYNVGRCGLNSKLNTSGAYLGDNKFAVAIQGSNSTSSLLSVIDLSIQEAVETRYTQAGMRNIHPLNNADGSLGMLYAVDDGLSRHFKYKESSDLGFSFSDPKAIVTIVGTFRDWGFLKLTDDFSVFVEGLNRYYYSLDGMETFSYVSQGAGGSEDLSVVYASNNIILWSRRRWSGSFYGLHITAGIFSFPNLTFTILDGGDNPITDAVIQVSNTTNASGNYNFNKLVSGLEYEYTITRAGYVTVNDTFIMPALDRNITVNMELE